MINKDIAKSVRPKIRKNISLYRRMIMIKPTRNDLKTILDRLSLKTGSLGSLNMIKLYPKTGDFVHNWEI